MGGFRRWRSRKRNLYCHNTKIKALNEQLKKIADANESVTYIDLNIILAKDSFLNADYSRNGIHLNGTGYAVWKNLIENHLL